MCTITGCCGTDWAPEGIDRVHYRPPANTQLSAAKTEWRFHSASLDLITLQYSNAWTAKEPSLKTISESKPSLEKKKVNVHERLNV